jgi:hypothetical protein
MKERPILFSAPMVRAILEGRKTQTRRIVKYNLVLGGIHPAVASIVHRGDGWFGFEAVEEIKRQYSTTFPLHAIRSPYGQEGDRLWVKETFQAHPIYGSPVYRADWSSPYNPVEDEGWPWKPSIFMPRKTSRITLEITDIRVERLQRISPQDAIKEGLGMTLRNEPSAVQRYAELWESINGKGSWDANPWVWAITFQKL